MRIHSLLAPVLVSGTLLAGSSAMAEDSLSKVVDYRNSLMTVFKWNMGPMGAMVKGEMPYDQDAFAKHAADLSAAAHLDLLAGFPEGSDEADNTDARADIWLDWAGFEAKYAALKKASGELAQTAAGGDLEAVKPKFGAVGEACKSCHKAFKE